MSVLRYSFSRFITITINTARFFVQCYQFLLVSKFHKLRTYILVLSRWTFVISVHSFMSHQHHPMIHLHSQITKKNGHTSWLLVLTHLFNPFETIKVHKMTTTVYITKADIIKIIWFESLGSL